MWKAENVKSAIQVDEDNEAVEASIVDAIPVYRKNASECSLNEEVGFGRRRRADDLKNITRA